MTKTIFDKVCPFFVALVMSTAFVSCVNEQYEISKENLDLNVTGFRDGVCLPLGSSAAIRLDTLVKRLGLEEDLKNYLLAGTDGAYTVTYSSDEPIDLSENLESLTGLVDIDKIDIKEKIDINLSSVNVDDFTFEGKDDFKLEENLSEKFKTFNESISDISDITENFTIDANVRSYSESLSDVDFTLDLGEHGGAVNLATLPSDLTVADGLQDSNISYSLAEISALLGKEITINEEEAEFTLETHLSYDFPKEVTSVSALHIGDNAKLKITVEMVNPCFTGGSVKPHVDMNLEKLFHLAAVDGAVHDDHIDSDFELKEDNGWRQEGTYDITGILFDPAKDCKKETVNGVEIVRLAKDVEILAKAKLQNNNLETSPAKLHEWLDDNEDRKVKINVKLDFDNLFVDDVTMGIKVPVEQEETFYIDIPAMNFPTEVESVEEVVLSESSAIKLDLSAAGLDRLGDLAFNLESLAVTFPDVIKVDGADATNTIVLSGVDLAQTPLSSQIKLEGIKIGEVDENGHVPPYTGPVKVIAKGEVSGELHTENLPKTVEEDVSMSGEILANIEIEDYTLKVKGYQISSQTHPELFKKEEIAVEVPEELSKMEGLIVRFKNDPAITIDIVIPDISVDIRAMGEQGLMVKFPQMIRFKNDLAYPYKDWYDADKHALVFTQEEDFPDKIELPIDCLVIDPEKNDEDGKWYSSGYVEVDGAVGIKEGVTLVKADVDKLSQDGAKVAFYVTIPKLEPESASVDTYADTIEEETIPFEPLKDVDLPEELAYVEQIVLDDVYLSLAVKTGEGFPSIGDDAALSVSVEVMLPDFIVIDDDRYSDGKLAVTGVLEKPAVPGDPMQIVIDPIRISSLDLNMTREALSGLMTDIKVAGGVSLSGASLDFDEWLGEGKTHSLDIVADLKTMREGAGQKLGIKKVTGKIDYQMDPVNTVVDLTEVSKALSGDNISAVVDLETFYVSLGLSTNLGVPVKAALSLTPYYGAEPGETMTKNISIDGAESADEEVRTVFWISDREPESDETYDKYIDIDIFSMLYKDETKTRMIDSLKVNIIAGTDADKMCIYEPSAEYSLKVDYSAGIPLEFGDDFKFEYRDTIGGMPDELGMIFEYAGSVGLGGKIESSLPFNLSLRARLLDSEDKEIAVSETNKPFIKSCDASGNPRETDINLVIDAAEGVDFSDIASIELIFTADARDASGAPAREDSYIKVNSLYARIPKGITIDLAGLLFEEEETEEGEGTESEETNE